MSPPAIAIRGRHKRFRALAAVRGVDLELRSGIGWGALVDQLRLVRPDLDDVDVARTGVEVGE